MVYRWRVKHWSERRERKKNTMESNTRFLQSSMVSPFLSVWNLFRNWIDESKSLKEAGPVYASTCRKSHLGVLYSNSNIIRLAGRETLATTGEQKNYPIRLKLKDVSYIRTLACTRIKSRQCIFKDDGNLFFLPLLFLPFPLNQMNGDLFSTQWRNRRTHNAGGGLRKKKILIIIIQSLKWVRCG